MTVKELLESKKGSFDTVEIFRPRFGDSMDAKAAAFKTDYIKAEDDAYPEAEVISWEIMGEAEYNASVLANSSETADFADWYDDKNCRVLCILVPTEGARPSLSERIEAAARAVYQGMDPVDAAREFDVPEPEPLTDEQKEKIAFFESLSYEEQHDFIEVDGRKYVRKVWERNHKG